MMQMNLLTKQKETHRVREWIYGYRGEGEILREFGMDMNTLLYLKWITRTYWIAHGTLLKVMWQPGWERDMGENICLYVAESL